jgi:uncharacterized repeat protein (TIGR01451 family)
MRPMARVREIRYQRRRMAVAVGVVAVALAGLASPAARADELITETFTGAAVTDPSFTSGGTNFQPCLTASQSTSQTPIPGCAAGAVALPPGGDPPGSGALRLTDNGTGRAGFVLYNRALPLTAGVQVDFDFFTYRGNGTTGADGLAFFLADGNVNLTQPGGYGGALGYAPNRVNGQPGLAGGYIGLGLDEYGNYSNTSTQGTGCLPNPAVGFRPQSVALRGPGSGLSGYCLIGTTPVSSYGGLSRPAATTRTATGVLHSARLVVDPLGTPGAQVTVFIDFYDGGGLRQVFQAPLPPNPPSTFKFGFAAATGGSYNIHEIRFLRVSSILELPRLSLTKTHAGGVVAGTVHDFQLQATVSGAAGDGPEQAPVTITDPLPEGDTVAATPSGTGWDCSATVVGATTASCTYQASPTAPLVPGAALPPLTVPVRVAADHVGIYVNTATASSSDNANTPVQSSASDSYTVTQQADVSVTKTAAPTPVAVGEPVTYTLTARNAGPSDATDVVVSDPLPAGMGFVSGSAGCAPVGATVGCTAARLAPGASAQFQVVTRPDASLAGQTVPNTATVAATQPDPNRDDNSATATVDVGRLADLSVRKSATPSPLVPGTNVTFELVVTNDGPNPASNVTVSDPLPDGLTFVSASPGCGEASGTVTCTIGSLDPGASQTFTVTAKVAGSVDRCVSNSATASSDTPDPDMSDNTSRICVPIEGRSDLSIAKHASATTVPIGGGQVIYTLVVKNEGPSDDPGVKVTDPLAAGLTLVSADPSQGTCSTADNAVSCDLGALRTDGSAQVLVTANTTGMPGCITNTARIQGAHVDPDPDDNQGSAQVCIPEGPPPPPPPPPPSPPAPPVPPSPPAPFDLEVDKRASHSTVTVGQRLTYTIVVTNNGPGAAADAKLTDTFTRRASVVSVRTTTGSCTKAIPLTCSLGTIESGASVTITVVIKPRQSGRGQRNAASATGNGSDATPDNNLDTVDVTVRKVALRLSKVAARATVRAGDTLSYRIRVSNPTKGEARNVKVCDQLPSGLSFVSSSPKGKHSGSRRCWTIKSLKAAQSRTYRVTVRTAKGANGRKVNRATLRSPDIKPAIARRPVRIRGGRPGVTG